ncbi:hypothetical protein [Pleomorphomonas sp. JP5]|uniref:hypothetical protein n=1 Tax=Pleomorphomonas sp. JP5 TaxID=2942998 RepID=UPI0020442BC5|nr:hypothetical protein [Pleomorphomonas sp. JP5]MCM5557314.1 hypothetical protein [Pleomorphomonas sp. JP5]
MATMDARRRSGPSGAYTAPSHLFHVGDAVNVRRSYLHAAATGVYHVVATLPPSEGQFQYRVRSEAERYERVVSQDRLEAVAGERQGALARKPLS